MAKERRAILVVVGGTNLGKSLYAGSVLERVATVLGVPSFLEVTVEADDALDFSSFDVDRHSGVLLDGLGDIKTLLSHREEVQGRPKVCMGGRSNTMIYSYPFALARRAVVVTADLGARNLHLLRTHHWLSDSRNVVLVWLQSQAWLEDGASAASVPEDLPPRLPMTQWTVDELAARLENADAEGLAATLKKSSVNGADFAEFTLESFVGDLGLTPFAAKKHAPMSARRCHFHVLRRCIRLQRSNADTAQVLVQAFLLASASQFCAHGFCPTSIYAP